MVKHKRHADPKIENHLPGKQTPADRRTYRKAITLWIKEAIIEDAGPQPGTRLREFIEKNYSIKGLENDEEDPRIQDFVRPRIGKPRQTARRSITLQIDEDIIEACKANPALMLRDWIESRFWKKVS